jgi:hypothetical protein
MFIKNKRLGYSTSFNLKKYRVKIGLFTIATDDNCRCSDRNFLFDLQDIYIYSMPFIFKSELLTLCCNATSKDYTVIERHISS